MIYLKEFDSHASYESEVNGGGGVDFKIPNVSYCKDANDVHFNPYNLIEFYVGEITGTTPQTVKIYTDLTNFNEVTVSKGNKWYSYVLPKDKGLCKIESGTYDDEQQEWSNGIVTKAVVKANINYNFDADKNESNGIVPWEITEASFKGSDTSKVTIMDGMFIACTNLKSLDLSSFDTSKVTSMNGMFYICANLKSLDLSSFDTSKVTSMEGMFAYCSGLTSLDVSNFDNSKVTNMTSMFADCNGLTSLNLRNFNTSNVTFMNGMFYGCSGLTSLDLRSFNTSNVTDMGSMFDRCSNLTSLDLSGWDTSKVTNMWNMFNSCGALKKIKMDGCSQTTIDKIKAQLKKDGITRDDIIKTE